MRPSAGAGGDLRRHDGARHRLLRIHRLRSSDDGRLRHITTPISPAYTARILQLQEAGATDDEPHPVVAEAKVASYFSEWGKRAVGLRADMTLVESIEFEFCTPKFRACYGGGREG